MILQSTILQDATFYVPNSIRQLSLAVLQIIRLKLPAMAI